MGLSLVAGMLALVYVGAVWEFVFPHSLVVPLISFKLSSPRAWQFIASEFFHDDFFHWAYNSIQLLLFAAVAERRLGSRALLRCFLWGSVAGGLAEWAWMAQVNTDVELVGSSGGVMGVEGAALACLLLDWRRSFSADRVWQQPLRVFIWVAVLAVLKQTLGDLLNFAEYDQVAHQDHLGGLLGGLIWFWLMRRRNGKGWPKRSEDSE